MAVNLSLIGGAGWQFFDDSGSPLSGGKIYTYAAGTTTPLTTYTSRDGLTANANPIILDAAGRTPQQIWSTEGLLYKYVIVKSNDVQIRVWDNIGGTIVASDLGAELANTTDNSKGDALIGFRQSNSSGFLTGATARTVNDKLQETVSVKDFGAVGNGVTDDTAKIQAALNSASNKELYFPDGVYLVYALKVLAGTTVNLGASTIKKRPATAGDQTLPQFTGNSTIWWSLDPAIMAPVFYITGDNVTFQGGTIDGNRANETYATTTWGGSFAVEGNRCGILASHSAIPDVKSLTIDGVKFANMYGDAVVTEYLTGNTRIENCVETNGGSLFVYVTGQANPPNYSGRAGTLIFNGNYLDGVRTQNAVYNPGVLDGCNQIIFTNNTVVGVNQPTSGGFKIGGNTFDVLIDSNVFKNEYIKPQSASTFTGDSFVCSNNSLVSITPTTHITGLTMGLATYLNIVVANNSVVDGVIGVETARGLVNVSNNSINLTRNCIPVGNTFWAAMQLNNNISGAPGATVLANGNLINAGDIDNQIAIYCGGLINDMTISNNVIKNTDRAIHINDDNSPANAKVKLIGNTFENYRGLGRINLGTDYDTLIITRNVFKQLNATPPVYPIGAGTVRALYITAYGSSSLFAVTNNVVDATNLDGVAAAPWLQISVSGAVNLLNISHNLVSAGGTATTGGYNITWSAGNSATTFVCVDNYFNFAVLLQGTLTNEIVSGNTGNGLIQGLSKKPAALVSGTATTVGAAGAAAALPATPLGYLTVNVDSGLYKVPYYNA